MQTLIYIDRVRKAGTDMSESADKILSSASAIEMCGTHNTFCEGGVFASWLKKRKMRKKIESGWHHPQCIATTNLLEASYELYNAQKDSARHMKAFNGTITLDYDLAQMRVDNATDAFNRALAEHSRAPRA